MEYFVVNKLTSNLTPSGVKGVYEIHKYRDSRSPDAVNYVREYDSGEFRSDDKGFHSHNNESANKRIRIVKKYIHLGESIPKAFWIDESGKIVSR